METINFFEVEETLVNKTWRLQLDIESTESVIKYVIQNNPSKELIDGYKKDLNELKIAYEVAKNEVSDYLRPLVMDKFGVDTFDWNLDFNTRKAYISF